MREWVQLLGEFDESKNKLIFKGRLYDAQSSAGTEKRPIAGKALTSERFGEGTISAEVEFSKLVDNPQFEIIFNYNPQSRAFLSAGFGYGSLFTIREFDQKWTDYAFIGDRANLRAKRKYKLKVSLHGSRVTLNVNGVDALSTNLPVSPGASQVGVFCVGSSNIIVSNFQVERVVPKAFIVMQFSAPFNELYTDVIKPVCHDFGIDPRRADETYAPGLVIADIVRQLEESKVVIADVSPINANVYYEVGYAHALNKPTILIAEKSTALPFDVRPFRALFYENSIGGKKKIEEGLRNYLNSILNEST